MNRNATIAGNIGSGVSISLGRDGVYAGGVFSAGPLSTGSRVRVDGRILSNGGVSIGRNADILSPIDAGGAVSIGRDGHFAAINASGDVSLGTGENTLGSLNSSGNVFINRNSTIHGNVVHGGTISIGHNVAITGDVSTGAATPDTWSPQFRDAPALSATGAGTIHHGSNSDVTLAPGDYGNLSIDHNSTLHLSAGTYNFSSVSLARDTNVLLDNVAADIAFNVVGDASFGTGVRFDLLNNAGGDLLFQSGGNTFFGRNSIIEGDFRVFGDNLTLGRDTLVTGSLYSDGDLSLGPGVTLVPTPASAAALTMFGLVGLSRRRRQNSNRAHDSH